MTSPAQHDGDVLRQPGAGQWRRLSARMLLVHPVSEFLSLFPAFAGLFIFGQTQDDGMPWPIRASFIVVPVVLGVLRYLTTTYRITPERLQLRRGLLQRATLTAPIDRVRTVDITASPLHRLLRLAKVTIGTGADAPVELNGLPAQIARQLRVDLLHRVTLREQAPDVAPYAVRHATAPNTQDPTPAHGQGQSPDQETLICAFRPRWITYAPFTLSGWLVVVAVVGFLAQFGTNLIERIAESEVVTAVEAHLAAALWWIIALEVLLLLVVIVVVFSVASYLLSYWGYRLTRHPGGTMQVTRGLLTTRTVNLEEARVRGVRFYEPALLRLAGGARLSGLLVGSGMSATPHDATGRAMLTPPTAASIVRAAADQVLRTSEPLAVRVTPHGPAARRRRFTRAALAGLFILVAAGGPVWWWGAPSWILPAAAVPLLLTPVLARERYRALGHAVADGYLVSRSGIFPRGTDVLALTGVIGWVVHASFFQRRVGLVTLWATTAAGFGMVRIIDVPVATAYQLIGELTPALTRLPGR